MTSEPKGRLGTPGVIGVSAALMAVFGIVPALLLRSMRTRFPAEVATHWGLDGQPDAWSSFTGSLLTNAVLAFASPLIMLALGAALRAAKGLGAVSVGTTAFIATLGYGTMWLQRDGEEAPIGAVVLISTVIGLVAGALTWMLLRRLAKPVTYGPGPAASRQSGLSVPDGTKLAWTGHLRVSRGVVIFAVATATATLGFAVFLWLRTDPWLGTSLAILALVVVVAFSTLAGQVTIDQRGVRVSTLGVKLVRVPLHEITDAGILTVEPLGEYGGWGWRLGLDGASEGFVTARGEGIVVRRATRRDLVLTVDGAREAARVLVTLLRTD